MDNTLGDSAVEQAASSERSSIGLCTVLCFYCIMDCTRCGLELRAYCTIAQTSFFVGDDSLLLTFNVRHVLSSIEIQVVDESLRIVSQLSKAV